MPQQNVDIDPDNDFEDDPAGLRKALKAAIAGRKVAEQALADVQSESRGTEIDRRFKEAGIPDTAKGLVGKDVNLDEWFETYTPILGTKAPEGEQTSDETKTPSATQSDEEKRAKDLLDSTQAPKVGGSLAERLRAATTPEERAAVRAEGIASINAAS